MITSPIIVAQTLSSARSQPQRIYIGGIDPSRGLTVSEVWERLEAKLTNPGGGIPTLHWSDLYCGKCCLQVTVTSDDIENSPIKIVQSSFHNVMWKGCKLRVDEARPHFLQRLEEERNLRQRNESLDSNGINNGPTEVAVSPPEPQQLSRFWKVRRGYCGEPVKHVDTQSCDVTSWSMFERIHKRHKKQQEKDRLRRIELLKNGSNMTVKEAQKRAYYNRSIRLRFTDDMDINTSSCSATDQVIVDDVTSSDQSIDTSDDDDSSESPEKARKVQNESGKYVWSDDDNSIAESDEIKYMSVRNVEEIQSNVQSSLSHKQDEHVANCSTYIWSDDENSSDSDFSNHLTKYKSIKPRDLDEFESALDLTREEGINGKEMVDMDDNNTTNDYDITMDVERNLSILSQLFPETSKVKSDTVVDGQETKLPLSTPQSSSSGWGALGQMLRFDPSRPQSTSFLLSDDVSDKPSHPESTIKNGYTSDVNLDQRSVDEDGLAVHNPTKESTAVTTTMGVYEQKKLELVFKEARESVPMMPSDRNDGGEFVFGFEIDDAAMQNEASSSSFAFNFGINETNQDNFTAENLNKIDVDGRVTQDAEFSPAGSTAGSTRPRFLAFEFPNHDMLNEMVHNFYYKINDGERILSDVDGWRNDPSVKEKWLKERLALTQDWKRKKKFALSKKQKRSRKG